MRIVLVEDDENHRSLMEKVLRLEGYDVAIAADGARGLEVARAKKPELLITDQNMPGMSGTELCRAIRSDATLRDCYILLVTGETGQDTKLDALRSGADDYIHKPIRREEFLARIEISVKIKALQDAARTAEAKAASLERIAGSSAAIYEVVLKDLEAVAGHLKAKEEMDAYAGVRALRLKVLAAKEGAPAKPEQSIGDMLGLS